MGRCREAQQGLDTRTPAGKAMFQMMGVFAEFERAIVQERVRAGLKRAKSEGKQLGRPRIAPALEERIRKALATPGRPGVRVIAKQFGVDPGTVQRISRPFEGTLASAVKPDRLRPRLTRVIPDKSTPGWGRNKWVPSGDCSRQAAGVRPLHHDWR